jgi:predicted benzoate:H+ symporter BenE
MRAALTPSAPHMSLPIVIAALIVVTAIFWTLGMRSFMKRAVG